MNERNIYHEGMMISAGVLVACFVEILCAELGPSAFALVTSSFFLMLYSFALALFIGCTLGIAMKSWK